MLPNMAETKNKLIRYNEYIMRLLKKYYSGFLIIGFCLLVAIAITYTSAVKAFFDSPPCTPQQRTDYMMGYTKCTDASVYKDELSFYTNPQIVINWSIKNISILAMIVAAFIAGLIGGKKWFIYSLIVFFLIQLISEDGISIIWPHPGGAGRPLVTLEEQNGIRWEHFMHLIEDLPIILLVSSLASISGRILSKIIYFIFNNFMLKIYKALLRLW